MLKVQGSKFKARCSRRGFFYGLTQGVTTQYHRMEEGLNISFYVSFPFDEWLRKIQNWKEKLTKPEFQSEHETVIGEKRAVRLRLQPRLEAHTSQGEALG